MQRVPLQVSILCEHTGTPPRHSWLNTTHISACQPLKIKALGITVLKDMGQGERAPERVRMWENGDHADILPTHGLLPSLQ